MVRRLIRLALLLPCLALPLVPTQASAAPVSGSNVSIKIQGQATAVYDVSGTIIVEVDVTLSYTCLGIGATGDLSVNIEQVTGETFNDIPARCDDTNQHSVVVPTYLFAGFMTTGDASAGVFVFTAGVSGEALDQKEIQIR